MQTCSGYASRTDSSQTIVLSTRKCEKVDLLHRLGNDNVAPTVFDGEFEEHPPAVRVLVNFPRHGGCATYTRRRTSSNQSQRL